VDSRLILCDGIATTNEPDDLVYRVSPAINRVSDRGFSGVFFLVVEFIAEDAIGIVGATGTEDGSTLQSPLHSIEDKAFANREGAVGQGFVRRANKVNLGIDYGSGSFANCTVIFCALFW